MSRLSQSYGCSWRTKKYITCCRIVNYVTSFAELWMLLVHTEVYHVLQSSELCYVLIRVMDALGALPSHRSRSTSLVWFLLVLSDCDGGVSPHSHRSMLRVWTTLLRNSRAAVYRNGVHGPWSLSNNNQYSVKDFADYAVSDVPYFRCSQVFCSFLGF